MIDYSSTNPVPKRGDKIRITYIHGRDNHLEEGDIVTVIDGSADFYGKPGFSAQYETYRGRKRIIWKSAANLHWEIIERDGKPCQKEVTKPEAKDSANALLLKVVDKVLSNEYLLKHLSCKVAEHRVEYDIIDTDGTAKNIADFCKTLAKELKNNDTND